MKIKCKNCETKYNLKNSSSCPSCGTKGGFLQEPSIKKVDGRILNLEDVLKHEKTGNEYTIKEFQIKGILAILTKSITGLSGSRTFISFQELNEYKGL